MCVGSERCAVVVGLTVGCVPVRSGLALCVETLGGDGQPEPLCWLPLSVCEPWKCLDTMKTPACFMAQEMDWNVSHGRYSLDCGLLSCQPL